MKKIVISGPILSSSGYGRMCRFALESTKRHQDKFDIYVLPTNWGNTGNISLNSEESNEIYEYIIKTQTFLQQTNNQPNFDISIQVTIPNEWKKMAPVNIGYTAGIETNLISPAWLQPSQQMNKIIVISEHAKSSFINTIFGDDKGNNYKVTTPVEVCHFPVREHEAVDLNLDLKHDFNFLAVCQWGPRKNLEQTIINFIEEFKNEEVGLVLKVNTANDSILDRETTESKLKIIVDNFPNRKCSVTLIHGHMSDSEMQALYKHPKIKCVISSTHGEGFGFPLFEAAYNETPVVATDWSGHLDFLTMKDEDGVEKKMFAKVDYELRPIAKEHVWKGVLEEGTSWAYPLPNSLKGKMREVYKDYGRFKSWAKKLNKWIRDNFTEDKIYDRFSSSLDEKNDVDSSMQFLNFEESNNQPIKKISFCISTNAKKVEKTLKSISSIKNTMKEQERVSYEIIVAGTVDDFKGINNVKLVSAEEDATNGMLAKLRNRAAENATGDVIVFLDDDILFDKNWLKDLLDYSEKNGWDVLGNRILLPDGGRYWDRAITNPHQMVNYNFADTDPRLYQTGCFWIVRKNVFDKHKWDSSIEYYAQKNGKMNEDVEYSDRLKKAGYRLKFNEKALVWHWDESYQEVQINPLTFLCLKKDTIHVNMLKKSEQRQEFNNLLQEI